MLGLFGTLDLGRRSLQVQQQGVEVTGHNLANVNNPAYARQRLIVQTSPTVPSVTGPQGNGADVAAIQQVRSGLLDRQVLNETSVTGFLESQQRALQYAQADLAQQLSSPAGGTDASQAVQGTGDQQSLGDGISDLFSSFQALATNPGPGSPARQDVVNKAQNLATRFNQIDQRLNNLQASLDDNLGTDVESANQLLSTIANLNDQIAQIEATAPGTANDLRDTRQAKLEELSKLVSVTTTPSDAGTINISIGGATLVTQNKVTDTLETYDADGGQRLVRTKGGGTPLTLTGGSIQGGIEVRDGSVQVLRKNLDSLASSLITEINSLHRAGFSVTGSTGADFFLGTGAGDLKANAALVQDPSLIQASAISGAVGDNKVALALAQLADKTHGALGNQTFSQDYAKSVSDLGQSLASVNNDLDNQHVVQDLLLRQRDSLSGVSLDEEMTQMMQYQKAYEASAHLISTIDQMLQTVLEMKQ